MSSSPSMQDLFAAARADAPSELVRDEVWGRVAAVTAVPAGAAAAAKAVVPATGKLVAVGAVIGATTAVVAGLVLGSLDLPRPETNANVRRTPAIVERGPAGGARLAEASPRGRHVGDAVVSAAAPPPPTEVRRADEASRVDAVRRGEWDGSGAGSATRADENASALATEARLVTEARTALVRGEPERALALARSTHRLAARALEPEELALEARALRALGRSDEALATELTLRRRFPSHTLSR